MENKLVYLKLGQLNPHPQNPRKDLGDLTELADSIRTNGIHQNLTVVPYWSPVKKRVIQDQYTIIIGHRRAAAAKLAGLETVPCVIVDMDQQTQLETMMVENMQRSDLTRIEEAEGFQLMLDLGQTVEQVAQKTGFGETTIRGRLNLLKLDRKALKKAESRGGTLQDYAEIQKLASPANQEKVLKAVGTAEFRDQLRKAQEQERLEIYLKGCREQLKQADWCRKKTDEDCGPHGRWEYHWAYDKYSMEKGFRIPEDAGSVPYLWQINHDGTITLYKAKNASELGESPEAVRRKALETEMKSVIRELKDLSKAHRQLRADFVRDFRAEKTYSEEIMELMLDITKMNAEDGWSYNNSIQAGKIGEFLKIDMAGSELDLGQWNRAMWARPGYVMLCMGYLLAEGQWGQSFLTTPWDSVTGEYPRTTPNKRLDTLYTHLLDMGYDMCQEEEQMMDGTHPLFARAARIKTEWKELNDRAKA